MMTTPMACRESPGQGALKTGALAPVFFMGKKKMMRKTNHLKCALIV